MKLVYESIHDFLSPKSKEEIIDGLGGDKSIVFKRSRKSETNFEFIGILPASFKTLKKLFGEPISGEKGDKISTMWVVEDNLGRTISIYDYKATEIVDGGLSVEEFRNLPYFEYWHIGGAHNLKGPYDARDPFAYILGKRNVPIVKDLMTFILLNE